MAELFSFYILKNVEVYWSAYVGVFWQGFVVAIFCVEYSVARLIAFRSNMANLDKDMEGMEKGVQNIPSDEISS